MTSLKLVDIGVMKTRVVALAEAARAYRTAVLGFRRN
jgi:hypothetical protein